MKKTLLLTTLILTITAGSSAFAAEAKSADGPSRPFFRLSNKDKKAAEAQPVAAAVPPPAIAPLPPVPAPANEREQEMLKRMDDAVQQIAGLYGNPRFVRLMTNDPSAAEQFKTRLELARSRDELASSVKLLEDKRADLDAQIALRTKTLTDMDSRLMRARAALDTISESGERMKRLIEEAAAAK